MAGYVKAERCLRYMDLRTGAIVLGHFDLVFDFFSVLGSVGKSTGINLDVILLQYYKTQYAQEITFIVSLLFLIISITFLVGIFKDKPQLLMFQISVYFIRFFVFLYAAISTSISHPNIWMILLYFVITVFLWHTIAVAYSLYEKMWDEKKRSSNTASPVYQPTTIPQEQLNMLSQNTAQQQPASTVQPQNSTNTEGAQHSKLSV